MINEKIKITEDVYDKCYDFARKCISTNVDKYAHRNQHNVYKITSDIAIGKMGEEIVYQTVSQKYPDLTTPDYNIYEAKDKSWDADLKSANFKLAVKSQDIQSALHFTDSWVFQKGNGSSDCDTEIFTTNLDNKLVSFVSLNVARRYAVIKGIVKVKWLHDNSLFKPMQKQNLDSKVAVYYEDLVNCELCQL